MRSLKVAVQRAVESKSGEYKPGSFVSQMCRVELEKAQGDPENSPWWILSHIELCDESPIEGLPILHMGFVDSHLHMSMFGDLSFQWDLRQLESVEDFRKELKKRVDEAQGQLIRGFGFYEGKWGLKLDDLANFFESELPDHAQVFLSRICGHSAGVSHSLRQSVGCAHMPAFITDSQLMELWGKLPPQSVMSVQDSWTQAQHRMLALGVVAVGDMSLDEVMIAALEDLCHRGVLMMDVQGVFEAGRCPELEARGPRVLLSPDLSPYLGRPAKLELLYWKKYLDGSLGSKTAWLSEAYVGEPQNFGESLISDDKLFSLVDQALKKEFLLSFHTIGDASLDQALRVGERFGGPMRQLAKRWNKPHRLEHVQMARTDQLELLKSQGFWSAHCQPHHREFDSLFILERLNLERYQSCGYRLKGFLDHDILLALGSDAPMDTEEPEQVLRAAQHHHNNSEVLDFATAVWHQSTGAQWTMGLEPGLLKRGARVLLTGRH